MNARIDTGLGLGRTLIAAAVASILLAACASAPLKPEGAVQVRTKLTQLQSDPELATRAPVAMKEAEVAVHIAEQPQADNDLAAYRVYMADTKVEIARAQAQTRFAEDQRSALTEQRASARLDSRTREADAAKGQVATARLEGEVQKLQADKARSEADLARSQAATAQAQSDTQKLETDRARDEADAAHLAAMKSQQEAAELQRQIEAMQAKVTDRGLVLTLGDVLFMTAKSDLRPGASGNLDRLVSFLNKYPERTVIIEGHTDSVGSDDYNQALSQRRADSVRSYLIGHGVGSERLAASGKGKSEPIESNDTAAGRQQNRRVAVIIANPPRIAVR
jgi:outer membrane protein OmpA-like peptidoglycan-associated protein